MLDAVTPLPADPAATAPSSILFTTETTVEIESCNACSGAVGRRSNELDFGGLACTDKACGDTLDLGPQLGAAARVVYSLSDDGLLLIADRNGALTTFTFAAKGE